MKAIGLMLLGVFLATAIPGISSAEDKPKPAPTGDKKGDKPAPAPAPAPK